MALSFRLKADAEATVPVEIDGTVYQAKAGSTAAMMACSELAMRMQALEEFADDTREATAEDLGRAVDAIKALDAPMRKAVAALFGSDAVEPLVGADEADLATAIIMAEIIATVLHSKEYLAATARRVSSRAKTAGRD